MSQTKDRAGQSRGHWTGKAAITETSTLALMMALTLQATPTLAQDAAQGAPIFAADMAPAIAPGPPVFASNPWEGFNFGGHVGYAFGTSSYQSSPPGWPAAGQVGLYGMDGQFGPLYH